MPLDKLKIVIRRPSTRRSFEINEFISYRLDSDLFIAADDFELVIGGYDPGIQRGDLIEIFINERRELTAIANRPKREYSRATGTRVTISGTDHMGLLTRHHIEKEKTYENYTTEAIIKELIQPVKYVSTEDIIIHAGIKNEEPPKKADTPWENKAKSIKGIFRTQPGETVFNALRRLALSKGLLLYNYSDGRIVIGGLVSSGTPKLFLTPANIKTMREQEDSWQTYSHVIFLAQKQIQPTGPLQKITAEDINSRAEVNNQDFPQDWYLPFVAVSNQGGTNEDLKKQAELKMAEFKYKEVGLTYAVAGHSQGLRNWSINSIVNVNDPIFPELSGDYLLAGRTFTMSREEGTNTILRLTKLGYSPK